MAAVATTVTADSRREAYLRQESGTSTSSSSSGGSSNLEQFDTIDLGGLGGAATVGSTSTPPTTVLLPNRPPTPSLLREWSYPRDALLLLMLLLAALNAEILGPAPGRPSRSPSGTKIWRKQQQRQAGMVLLTVVPRRRRSNTKNSNTLPAPVRRSWPCCSTAPRAPACAACRPISIGPSISTARWLPSSLPTPCATCAVRSIASPVRMLLLMPPLVPLPMVRPPRRTTPTMMCIAIRPSGLIQPRRSAILPPPSTSISRAAITGSWSTTTTSTSPPPPPIPQPTTTIGKEQRTIPTSTTIRTICSRPS